MVRRHEEPAVVLQDRLGEAVEEALLRPDARDSPASQAGQALLVAGPAPGEDLPGVKRAGDFLKAAKLGEETGVKDKRVVALDMGSLVAREQLPLYRRGSNVAEAEQDPARREVRGRRCPFIRRATRGRRRRT